MAVDDFGIGFYGFWLCLVLWILAMGFVVYGCGCGNGLWLSWLVVMASCHG